jgi:hypothetical protein
MGRCVQFRGVCRACGARVWQGRGSCGPHARNWCRAHTRTLLLLFPRTTDCRTPRRWRARQASQARSRISPSSTSRVRGPASSMGARGTLSWPTAMSAWTYCGTYARASPCECVRACCSCAVAAQHSTQAGLASLLQSRTRWGVHQGGKDAASQAGPPSTQRERGAAQPTGQRPASCIASHRHSTRTAALAARPCWSLCVCVCACVCVCVCVCADATCAWVACAHTPPPHIPQPRGPAGQGRHHAAALPDHHVLRPL